MPRMTLMRTQRGKIAHLVIVERDQQFRQRRVPFLSIAGPVADQRLIEQAELDVHEWALNFARADLLDTEPGVRIASGAQGKFETPVVTDDRIRLRVCVEPG